MTTFVKITFLKRAAHQFPRFPDAADANYSRATNLSGQCGRHVLLDGDDMMGQNASRFGKNPLRHWVFLLERKSGEYFAESGKVLLVEIAVEMVQHPVAVDDIEIVQHGLVNSGDAVWAFDKIVHIVKYAFDGLQKSAIRVVVIINDSLRRL